MFTCFKKFLPPSSHHNCVIVCRYNWCELDHSWVSSFKAGTQKIHPTDYLVTWDVWEMAPNAKSDKRHRDQGRSWVPEWEQVSQFSPLGSSVLLLTEAPMDLGAHVSQPSSEGDRTCSGLDDSNDPFWHHLIMCSNVTRHFCFQEKFNNVQGILLVVIN